MFASEAARLDDPWALGTEFAALGSDGMNLLAPHQETNRLIHPVAW
jgi:hypothetical protein